MSQSLLSRDHIRRAVSTLVGEELARYEQSLGRFIMAFSHVEANLQNAVWELAGVPSPTAQAVFSGVRIEAALGLIRRIAEAQKWTKIKRDNFDGVLVHLGHINRLRNDIVHYGADMHAPNRWIVSNEIFVHFPERIRRIAISSPLLDNASSDLYKIDAHIVFLTWGHRMPSSAKRVFRVTMRAPWLCKLPLPTEPAGKSRKHPQKPPRQRQPSHE
jgi:hypothetical protein